MPSDLQYIKKDVLKRMVLDYSKPTPVKKQDYAPLEQSVLSRLEIEEEILIEELLAKLRNSIY